MRSAARREGPETGGLGEGTLAGIKGDEDPGLQFQRGGHRGESPQRSPRFSESTSLARAADIGSGCSSVNRAQ